MKPVQLRYLLKTPAIILLAAILASCTTAPTTSPTGHYFRDHLFTAPSERINADDVFAVSHEMKNYLQTEIADQLRTKGLQQGLIDALYSKQQLKVEYDSAQTRNAAQTFQARTGNCLSLIIMTAALARELGLPVVFQSVIADESWARSGGLYFSIGHVNLTVGKKLASMRSVYDESALKTIDFLPLGETRGQRAFPISRETVIAMYLNNRAAEALARGNVNDAYWWAREAITQDPNFLSSYNTLGVVYRRHRNLPEAELALMHALQRATDNIHVMSNLAIVLNDLSRHSEAKVLNAKIERIQPFPPFHFFNLGQSAMKAKNFSAARELFAREVARDAYNHEFHFWLAVAYSGLGEFKLSRNHLAIAKEFSTTVSQGELYGAKLERLNAYK